MLLFFSLAALILLIIFLLVFVFNRFAGNRNLVKDAWSNIDVVLKKRYDLIPNLVNTVKGYAAHESGTLERVIQARNQAMSAGDGDINGRIAAENQLQQALRSIFALGEAYPDLKADASFIDLQARLSQVETELERSRRYYNATVRENNTFGESLPGVLFAGFLGYHHFDFFEAEEAERVVPRVDFPDKDKSGGPS